jgi:hypothetical protein
MFTTIFGGQYDQKSCYSAEGKIGVTPATVIYLANAPKFAIKSRALNVRDSSGQSCLNLVQNARTRLRCIGYEMEYSHRAIEDGEYLHYYELHKSRE